MGAGNGRRLGWVGVAVALVAVLGPLRAEAQDAVPEGGPLDGTPLCGVEHPVGPAQPLADDQVLRVATFNVLHAETAAGDASLGQRLPLLADAIAGSGADVVGAQEVTRNVAFDAAHEAPQRHGVVARRLASAVAARTGEAWSWCWSLSNPHVPLTPDVNPGGGNALDEQMAVLGNFPEPGDFSEGLAVLSRFPIDASRFRRLPPRSYEAAACALGNPDPLCAFAATFDSRQVLWARVAAPGGRVDVFTTHLAHTLTPLSDTTKLLQAQQALAITSEWATADATPDLLLGDFNSGPDGPALAATAAAGFVDTYRASGGPACSPTATAACSGGPPAGDEVHSPGPQRPMSERIDYVLARSPTGCALAVPDSHTIGDRPAVLPDGRSLWPSDHVGFVSALSCTASTPAPPGPVASGGGQELPATGGTAPPWLAWASLGVLSGLRALRSRTAGAARTSGSCRRP